MVCTYREAKKQLRKLVPFNRVLSKIRGYGRMLSAPGLCETVWRFRIIVRRHCRPRCHPFG